MRTQWKGFPGRPTEVSRDEINRRILVSTGLSVAVAFVLASLYPAPLLMAAFSGLLLLMAFASGAMAALWVRRPPRDHLNLWDKSAMLAFVGLAAGMLVDVEAVRTFVELQAPAGDHGDGNVKAADTG